MMLFALLLLAPPPVVGIQDSTPPPAVRDEILLKRADRMPKPSFERPKRKLPWPFPGDFREQNVWNNYQQASATGVHAGVDFIHEAGTEVRAVEDGWVALVATNYPDWTTHHMLVVATERGGNIGWSYTHLEPSSYTVEVGDRVKRGQVLGEVGKFSLGDRPGVDHLHLDYVRFTHEPDENGKWHFVDLMDPLWFFDAPDDRNPEIAPLRLVSAGTWTELPHHEKDVWAAKGKVDLLAALRDQAFKNAAGNWGVAGVTLEISRTSGGRKWCKLVLDHRGPVGNARLGWPLYCRGEEVSAWQKELADDRAYGPWPSWRILRVTCSDGDGLIETEDDRFAWDTLAEDAKGKALFPDGTYEVTVRAFDLAGNIGLAVAKVRVNNE